MWGRFRVGVLIVIAAGIVIVIGQSSTVSLAGPGAGPGAGAGSAAPGATALRALDKPAFTATPDELLALGKAAPTGDWWMVVLRDQRDVSYDSQGRATVRRWRVYVVQVADRIGDSEDAVHATWHPSYQDRPVIRARAIAPSGTVVELDPAQITEPMQGVRGTNPDVSYLAAPLPLEAGSVVEQEIVTRDRESRTGGSVDLAPIGNPAPTSSTVISYSAPAAARLHHVERLLPAGARLHHQVAGGRETWRYEIAALPPRVGRELAVPDDVVVSPYVGAATGASWEAVARAYRKLLDQRIAAGPVDLPAELPHTASAETAAAITAWVHHHVHRKADGLNDALRVPRPPAETLQQGTGDDHDKTTLLVALLRQAGIRADVALVADRWDHRVDPDLPAVDAFDHAIVRARVGAGELWIDPGEELARPGQLPERDQGQRALVIADDTRALAITPRAAPADNTVRDVRTFVASEDGGARLSSVVRYTGVFEIERRDQLRGMRADQLKKMYGARSESEFGGTVERFASSNAEDLAAPFETSFEIKDVHSVVTEVEQIGAYLYPRSVLDGLPWLVTNKPDQPRGHDFVWSRPQVHEVENRIVIPPGYTLPVPEPDRVRSLGGGATFTEHRELDGRTLIVRFRFDTGKPRITPAELAGLQAALQEIGEEVVHIKIDHTAFALVDAGKPREALDECRRMIALHPAESLHHTQFARVLLRVGAGDEARREARKAVAMAPRDAGALVGLGWALSHDTLGRAFTYDWDRAGAVAALREARKLNPSYLGAPLTLAQALQHDPAGRLYDGADLAGAAEAWRETLALAKTDGHALALARVLFWSEQFAEAEKVARTAGGSDERDRWIVAAVAGRGGAAAAVQAAGELRSGTDRNPLLAFAGWTMIMVQRYDVANELLSGSGALSRGASSAASMMSKLRRHPPFQLRPADPRSVVQEMLLAQMDLQRKSPVYWDARTERELRTPAQSLPATLRGVATVRWISDLVQSTIGIEIDGGAGAWRASLDDDGTRSEVYLVLDRGAVKVIGGSAASAGVGRYILRGGDARADERARRLLDWLRADVDRTSSQDAARFKQLWGQGIAASHEAIQLAAAVLAGATDPDRVLPIAARCASTVPDAELACHELRFAVYREREQWSEAVAEDEAILALRPGLGDARARTHAWALARAGRFDEADRVLDAALARGGDRRDALWGRFEVAAMRALTGGSATDVLQRGDALVNDPGAGPMEFNYVAWHQLGLIGTPGMPGDLTGALELARKAVDRAPEAGGALNTLAAIEVESGQLDRALQDTWKVMVLRNVVEPGAGDWYVIGRILDQLGLTSDAIAAYKRVSRPPEDEVVSAYLLAQRRLAAIARP